LRDEWPDPPRLRPGQELTHDPARREIHRELGRRVIDGVAVFGDVEAGLSVGEVERSRALRDGVEASGLEEPRRPAVLDRLAALRVGGVARPENAHLSLDFLVRDARVIGDAAFARDSKLLEDRPRVLEREAVRSIESARDVLNDDPVLTRVA